MPVLRITNGSQEGVEIDLEIGVNLVGRVPEARVFLDDETVSPRHARLTAQLHWYVEDLESKNLTLHNKAEVEPGERIEVEHGDRLEFGGVQCEIDLDQETEAIEEAAAALDKAQGVINSLRAELAAARLSLKDHEAAIKARDAALLDAQATMKELVKSLDPNLYLTREQFDAERAKIEAAVQADAKRQIDAMNRRNMELEQKYVKLMTENETLARKLAEAQRKG